MRTLTLWLISPTHPSLVSTILYHSNLILGTVPTARVGGTKRILVTSWSVNGLVSPKQR